MLTTRFLGIIFLLNCFYATLNAQTLDLDHTVKKGKLANGLTYYLQHNTEPRKRATLYLVINAGSVMEAEHERGLAHFMEHMSFNGTQNFPKNELIEYLQRSGIRFGADLNAYTNFDETVYQLPIPTDDPEILHNGLKILRDWANKATLDKEEIEKERGVVLEEKRQRLGASQRIQDKTLPVVLNGSRYADRLPIGTEKVLKNFTPETIRAFYRRWYRPDLQAVIIVGDVDVAAIEKDVKRLFSDINVPVNKPARPQYRVRLNGMNRFLALTDAEVPQISIELTIRHPEKIVRTAADYRSSIERSLFSAMLQERLGELTKMPESPVINAGGGYQPFLRGIDALSIQFIPKSKQVKEASMLVFEELERVRQFGFTVDEISRAKQNYLMSVKNLFQERDHQYSRQLADQYKRHFLLKEAVPGISKEFALTKEILPLINETNILLLSRVLIKKNDRVLLITAPEKEKAGLPDSSTAYGWLSAAGKMANTRYVETLGDGSLMRTIPPSGSIRSEKKDSITGTTTWTLSNGAIVVLKPTDYKKDEIYFMAVSEGGTSLYDSEDYESVAAAINIISSSGIGNFDNVQLPKVLNGKRLMVQPFIAEHFEGMQGSSTVSDIHSAMQLLYLYFTAPRRDTTIFKRIMSNAEQQINNRYADPDAIFSDTISSVLGGYHPRRTPPTLEKLHSIRLDKSVQAYRERFANAGDFTFFFVGAINEDTLRQYVQTYIASLPTFDSTEKTKDLGIRMPSGRFAKTIYAGKEDKATVQIVIGGDYVYNAYDNIKLSALKALLQYRLTQRLREQEGGVYTPSVGVNRNGYPIGEYAFYISFTCAPDNVEILKAATLQEIERLRTEVNNTDLAKFKAENIRTNEINESSNDFWLSYLFNQHIQHADLGEFFQASKITNELTSDVLVLAAQKYLNTKNLITLVMMPEANRK